MGVINEAWAKLLPEEIVEQANILAERAREEERRGIHICPPSGNIFRALDLTPPETVKAVILGQDPYHTPGVATGLAFSIDPARKLVPSIRNIFKELVADIGCEMPQSGDLTEWAKRGILLLNTVLTVEEGKPTSHYSWGWQAVTQAILRACSQLPQPVAFLLWGAKAQAAASEVCSAMAPNKAVFCSSHPSPLGARKGSAAVPAFLGSRPFSRVNEFLREYRAEPVDWRL